MDLRLFRIRPAEAYPIVLERRRIFVLPTRSGLLFAFTLFAMLLASINYTLSLGYALTFLLAGVGVTSTFHAYRNLLGIEVNGGHGTPAHVGDMVGFEFRLNEKARRDRFAIGVINSEDTVVTDLPASSTLHVRLTCRAIRRGPLDAGRIVIETRFPLGLVRAWSVFTPDHTVIVYPAIEREAPSPPCGGEDHDGESSASEGSDDFAGLRGHRDTDSPRQMAWKAIARTDTLISKSFTASAGQQLDLRWFDLPDTLDTEARLSRLTRWVVDAAAQAREYTLTLPDQSIGPGHDATHRDRCLTALALFGMSAHS